MRRFYAIAVLAVAAGVAQAFISLPAFAACELKLGVVTPLSGAGAQWGLAQRGATELVAAEANAAGGLQVGSQKCKVSVIALDSKYSAEAAAAAGNNLAGQGVKFIIGPIGAPEMSGLKPIASRNGMLVMGDSFAKDAIGPQWPLVFHSLPGPNAWADAIVKVAKQKFGIKRVLIIAPNDQGGTDIATVDAVAYKNNGIEAVEEYYQRNTTNFAPIVTRIMNAHPDVVDIASSPPGDAGVLVKQLRQAGFAGPIGRLGGPAMEEILRVAGGPEVIKNFYGYDAVFKDAKTDALDQEYKRLLGTDAPQNTDFYPLVATTRMVVKAISKAGTIDDLKKVAAVLRSLPPDDPDLGQGRWTGQDSFGINQELLFPYAITLVMNGKIQPPLRMEAVAGK